MFDLAILAATYEPEPEIVCQRHLERLLAVNQAAVDFVEKALPDARERLRLPDAADPMLMLGATLDALDRIDTFFGDPIEQPADSAELFRVATRARRVLVALHRAQERLRRTGILRSSEFRDAETEVRKLNELLLPVAS